MSDVELTLGPAVKTALAVVFASKLPTASLEKYRGECLSICFGDIQVLSHLYRGLSEEEKAPTQAQCGLGYVHELAKGCELFVQAPVPKHRPAALEAHLRRVRKKLDKEDFENTGKPKKIPMRMKQEYDSLNFMSFGVNTLVLMATGFILCYVLGKSIFSGELMPVVCGLVGLVSVMVLETVLMAVREEKIDLRVNQLAEAETTRSTEAAKSLESVVFPSGASL